LGAGIVVIIGIDPGHPMSHWNGEALKAYVAGILDGEGSIGAKRRMPTKANHLSSPKYSVAISLSMTDEAPVRLVAELLKSEATIVLRIRKEGYKPIFQFDVENEKALALIYWCLPYLVAKRGRAELAIQLGELRRKSRQHRTKILGEHCFVRGRAVGHKYRVFGLSDEFVAQCEDIYARLLVGSPRSGQPGAWGRR
jgi:hypothetical protein